MLKFIDLFCGIGGFRYGFQQACSRLGYDYDCVFSSDIDTYCQQSYKVNFGESPCGNIKDVSEHSIPDHDVLLAGFPCQAFSIMGKKGGFEDTRGTLFFDIARILKAKKPHAFVLENVSQLKTHDNGKTLKIIMRTLGDLGYSTDYHVLNALDYGLPQKRERIFIVGCKESFYMQWPEPHPDRASLSSLLETDVPDFYYASQSIRRKRLRKAQPTQEPTIWHENKSKNISTLPYSCALRAGASYNYLLVNGERRLTPREMLRLQGFPESHKIVGNYTQLRKQCGNSLPVNVAREVIYNLLKIIVEEHTLYERTKAQKC